MVKKVLFVVLALLPTVLVWSMVAELNRQTDRVLPAIRHVETLNTKFFGADRIRLEGFIGDIEVVYDDTHTIFIEGEKYIAHTKLDMAAFESTSIEYRQEGDVAVLKWAPPKNFGGTVGFNGKIVLPKKVHELDVEVREGSLSVTGGISSLIITTGTTDVTVNDHEGNLVVDVLEGNVTLKNIKPDQVLKVNVEKGGTEYHGTIAKRSEFRSASGDLTLIPPSDTICMLDMDVQIGRVESDFELQNRVTRPGQVVNQNSIPDGYLQGSGRFDIPDDKLTIKVVSGNLFIKEAETN